MKPFDSKALLSEEELPGGWNWSHILKTGTALRITAEEEDVNVSALLFNALNYSERYNMADTLKIQFISFLTKNNACYSDMGRILLSIIDDTCGWHDTITGVSIPADIPKKYGDLRYQEARNGYYRNGLTSLLTEMAKYGMDKRDFHSGINFFTKIAVDSDGTLSHVPGHSRKGQYIDLHAEMDTLVILNSCPHPLDSRTEYKPGKVRLSLWKPELQADENPARTFCEQNGRGFLNTIRYQL